MAGAVLDELGSRLAGQEEEEQEEERASIVYETPLTEPVYPRHYTTPVRGDSGYEVPVSRLPGASFITEEPQEDHLYAEIDVSKLCS